MQVITKYSRDWCGGIESTYTLYDFSDIPAEVFRECFIKFCKDADEEEIVDCSEDEINGGRRRADYIRKWNNETRSWQNVEH